MPNHRKTERKKQETTRGDYGTPKSPWDTETPTREEDKAESAPHKAQRVREEERSEKGENKQGGGTKAPTDPTEDSSATKMKRMTTVMFTAMKEIVATQREKSEVMMEVIREHQKRRMQF